MIGGWEGKVVVGMVKIKNSTPVRMNGGSLIVHWNGEVNWNLSIEVTPRLTIIRVSHLFVCVNPPTKIN